MDRPASLPSKIILPYNLFTSLRSTTFGGTGASSKVLGNYGIDLCQWITSQLGGCIPIPSSAVTTANALTILSGGNAYTLPQNSSFDEAISWIANLLQITEVQVTDNVIDPNTLIMTLTESNGDIYTVDFSVLKNTGSLGVEIIGGDVQMDIDSLPIADPLSGSEWIPIDQNGIDKRVTLADIKAWLCSDPCSVSLTDCITTQFSNGTMSGTNGSIPSGWAGLGLLGDINTVPSGISSPDGGQWVELTYSTGGASFINQIVSSFIPGSQYGITFNFASIASTQSLGGIRVYLDGNIIAQTPQSSTYWNWQTFTSQFTATTTTHNIRFEVYSLGSSSIVAIDGVKLLCA